jgi:hypothetical protein
MLPNQDGGGPAMAPKDLSHSPSRREIVQEILRLEVPIEEDWDQIEEEISRAHTEGFP